MIYYSVKGYVLHSEIIFKTYLIENKEVSLLHKLNR